MSCERRKTNYHLGIDIQKEFSMKKMLMGLMAVAFCSMAVSAPAMAKDAEAIYKSKCKMCHKFDKKKMGPAFKDMNKDPTVLKATITNGRKMMPKWSGKLSEEEIDSMVTFIKSKQE